MDWCYWRHRALRGCLNGNRTFWSHGPHRRQLDGSHRRYWTFRSELDRCNRSHGSLRCELDRCNRGHWTFRCELDWSHGRYWTDRSCFDGYRTFWIDGAHRRCEYRDGAFWSDRADRPHGRRIDCYGAKWIDWTDWSQLDRRYRCNWAYGVHGENRADGR